MYFTSFKTEGSSSGRLFILLFVKHTVAYQYLLKINPRFWNL